MGTVRKMSRLVISVKIRVERALSRRRTANCLSNIIFDYKDAVRLEAERKRLGLHPEAADTEASPIFVSVGNSAPLRRI